MTNQTGKLTKAQLTAKIHILKEDLAEAKSDHEHWGIQSEINNFTQQLNELIASEDKLLLELRDNLIHDGINFEDTSVGWYRVSDLEQWAKNDLPDHEGIELVSVTKDTCIFKCEGQLFEIYMNVLKHGDEVMDANWDIRPYEEDANLGISIEFSSIHGNFILKVGTTYNFDIVDKNGDAYSINNLTVVSETSDSIVVSGTTGQLHFLFKNEIVFETETE